MGILNDFGIECEIPTAIESRKRSESAIRENIARRIEQATSDGKYYTIIKSNIKRDIFDKVMTELRGKGYEVYEVDENYGSITVYWGENNAS